MDLKESQIKSVLTSILKKPLEEDSVAREIIQNLSDWGGKNKEEFFQSLAKEIGKSTGVVFKEFLEKFPLEHRVKVTVEFEPIADNEKNKTSNSNEKKTESKAKKKTRKKSKNNQES